MSSNTTIMNSKGRITIPSKIRKTEGYKEGQEFAFLKTEDGYVLVPLLTSEELQKPENLISHDALIKSMDEQHKIDLTLEE